MGWERFRLLCRHLLDADSSLTLWRFCVSDRYGVGNESGTYPNYGQMTIGVPKDHPTIGDSGLTLVEAQSHFR